ncbi:sugar kinase [Sporolituus thermophilus]|uniref:2-dehydro-3-deoxygluconokinase n=1 Tax=Sporolituus thermophilus DSM 23256 TaxID=1123285 RepID=A0A1G7HT38_9FIRM|nr:sugar kinase [Sporolituus thermophilus]SDF03661.1 2-dehydro-3-deoxygluconokinase [Sporolituus thermophilus DSM 23256]
MAKVVCFGEIMLRLSPPGYLRFEQATSFDVVYGGGEANVCVSLANYGEEAVFVTKVPDNPIGQAAINEMRRYGVDTRYMIKGGKRLGIYFCEKGASQRASKVVYDRAGSAISQAKREDFDWAKIFAGANWFHFTGITPALGDNVAECVLDAVKAAKEAGLTVSCDLNFRKNLWTSEKAGQVMAQYMPYVDVCIANEEDAEKVFGIKAADTDIIGGKLSHEGYKDVAKQLAERFGFKAVAITLRGSISASDNNWAAMLYKDGEFYFSRNYAIHIVDRVGGGDSFGGGLIYALLNGYSNQDALEFAVAASCLKHTIEGDHNHVTVSEVKALMAGDGSGRVQR